MSKLDLLKNIIKNSTGKESKAKNQTQALKELSCNGFGKADDWNQNNETAADYIKNRPFYEEFTETEIVNAPAVEFRRYRNPSDNKEYYYQTSGNFSEYFDNDFVFQQEDQEYVVYIGGKRYESICQYDGEFELYIGSIEGSYENNNQKWVFPFCLTQSVDLMSGPKHEFEFYLPLDISEDETIYRDIIICSKTTKKIAKLPKKFLETVSLTINLDTMSATAIGDTIPNISKRFINENNPLVSVKAIKASVSGSSLKQVYSCISAKQSNGLDTYYDFYNKETSSIFTVRVNKNGTASLVE